MPDLFKQETESIKKRIRKVFNTNPDCAYTPHEVKDELELQNLNSESFLISSVRKAINNLTTEKVLRRLKTKRPERYGAENHLWILNNSK